MRASLTVLALAASACSGGGSGPGDGCSEAADSCGGDTICVDGRCESAFGRVYEIRDINVQSSTTNGSGETWDTLGGAPDLFVQIVVDGTVVATTSVANDSFSGSFGGPSASRSSGDRRLCCKSSTRTSRTMTRSSRARRSR